MIRLLIALVLLGTVWASSPVHANTPAGNKADMISVPTFAAMVSPGTVISENDLVWTDVSASYAKRHVVVDPSEIVGMAVRRRLRPGEPISLMDIRKPILISKGALVTMRVKLAGIELTATGKAMDQGTLGDMVRILNPTSNRIVPAVVAGPNMASVPVAQ